MVPVFFVSVDPLLVFCDVAWDTVLVRWESSSLSPLEVRRDESLRRWNKVDRENFLRLVSIMMPWSLIQRKWRGSAVMN